MRKKAQERSLRRLCPLMYYTACVFKMQVFFILLIAIYILHFFTAVILFHYKIDDLLGNVDFLDHITCKLAFQCFTAFCQCILLGAVCRNTDNNTGLSIDLGPVPLPRHLSLLPHHAPATVHGKQNPHAQAFQISSATWGTKGARRMVIVSIVSLSTAPSAFLDSSISLLLYSMNLEITVFRLKLSRRCVMS